MIKGSLSPYINHFISADTVIPNPTDPQSWNRYGYVNNNPLRYTDPTGHMLDDGANEGGGGCNNISCFPQAPSNSSSGGNNTGSNDNNQNSDTDGNEQLQFCLTHPYYSECTIPETGKVSQGYSNPDLDALYFYWENVLMPFNDFLSAEDIYRITSQGGWRASRNALNLGVLEAIAQGGRQVHRDSWYQTLTPTQRLLRPVVAGGEAFLTDGISGVVGKGYAGAGFVVGGPPGAFAGQLAGATYTTRTMDRFWYKVNSNYLNFLGAWP